MAGTVATSMLRVLILHGLHGSGPEHWQTWLAERLRGKGVEVRYPDLPACDEPCPDRWGMALDEHLSWLDAAGPGEDRVVVCHSLACVLWLRLAARARRPRADRVVLVAPPCAAAGARELEGFFPHGATAEDVARAARRTDLLCGDEDPWCPPGAAHVYGQRLGLPTHVVADGGHLNVDAGYGAWPAVEELVLYGAKNGVEA
jgi:predicted alpha/beta hydrolase family esterase